VGTADAAAVIVCNGWLRLAAGVVGPFDDEILLVTPWILDGLALLGWAPLKAHTDGVEPTHATTTNHNAARTIVTQ
jgi:hypothetical protein